MNCYRHYAGFYIGRSGLPFHLSVTSASNYFLFIFLFWEISTFFSSVRCFTNKNFTRIGVFHTYKQLFWNDSVGSSESISILITSIGNEHCHWFNYLMKTQQQVWSFLIFICCFIPNTYHKYFLAEINLLCFVEIIGRFLSLGSKVCKNEIMKTEPWHFGIFLDNLHFQ